MQNIVIIGDGGIGSNLSVTLIKLLSFYKKNNTIKSDIKITICDGDIVEDKNLIRQYFLPSDKGKKKANITALHLTSIPLQLGVKGIEISSFPEYVKPTNISALIKESSIVLVGVDNYITRKVIEDYTNELKDVFVVFGANEYTDGDVNIMHKENGKHIFPKLSKKHPEILKRDKMPDEMSCEEASQSSPQLILANTAVAQYMLEAVNSFISSKKVNWHQKYFDLETGNVRKEGGQDGVSVVFGNNKPVRHK